MKSSCANPCRQNPRFPSTNCFFAYNLVHMPSFTPHPNSWFADDGWIEALNQQQVPVNAQLMATRVKGLRAWITPSWALDSHVEEGNLKALCTTLEAARAPLIVCDLPPGLRGEWAPTWLVQERHTRWLRADEATGAFPPMPKHRAKQARKGFDRGLQIEAEGNINILLKLHQLARERKSIASDTSKLSGLLSWVLASEHQSTYIARNEEDQCIASATFLHDPGRTIYAFGGQIRSDASGLATVMLIEQGIADAQAIGNSVFDFGGSSDPGVDRFYSEFGAEKYYRERAIRVSTWAKPWLKMVRSDLL